MRLADDGMSSFSTENAHLSIPGVLLQAVDLLLLTACPIDPSAGEWLGVSGHGGGCGSGPGRQRGSGGVQRRPCHEASG